MISIITNAKEVNKMADSKFNEMLGGLFKNMEGFVDSNTVVGDAITLPNGIILIPLVDVTFGAGGGAYNKEAKNKTGGGVGGKMTPNSVVIIDGDHVRLLNVKEQDALTKCLDLVPEISRRIKNLKNGGSKRDELAEEIAREAVEAQAKNK